MRFKFDPDHNLHFIDEWEDDEVLELEIGEDIQGYTRIEDPKIPKGYWRDGMYQVQPFVNVLEDLYYYSRLNIWFSTGIVTKTDKLRQRSLLNWNLLPNLYKEEWEALLKCDLDVLPDHWQDILLAYKMGESRKKMNRDVLLLDLRIQKEYLELSKTHAKELLIFHKERTHYREQNKESI